jgi:hypothetical protein
MKVKTNELFHPDSTYLTNGKEYQVYQYDGDPISYSGLSVIIDDDNEQCVIIIGGCAHIDGKAWTVVEE